MKVYCETCHQDITVEVDKNIENYRVGRIVCPHCRREQKRYISEADVLLFFGISETFYVMLSLLTEFLFRRWGVSLLSILILAACVIASYFASKSLSAAIYEKAFFKKENRNSVFHEDAETIQRNISWQFMLFFAIIISYLTIPEGKPFFAIAMPLSVILTFAKFFLQLRNEKR